MVAAAIGGVVTLFGAARERRHRTNERNAIERHQATLRRQEAHDEARETYLPKAEQLALWAVKLAAEKHYEEDGTFGVAGTNKDVPQEERAVLDLLRELKYGHPTKDVRDKANATFDEIHIRWTEMVEGGQPLPVDAATATNWQVACEAIVDSIHTPPS